MENEYQPIEDAFSIHRAFGHGFTAIRMASGPMWLAGLLMWISDGCVGSTNIPSLPGSDDDPSAWFALPRVGYALAAQVLGSAPAGPDPRTFMLWLVGIVVALVLVALLLGLLLLALNCWAQTGYIRLHVNILEHCSDELAPLFSGKDRFWHMAGYKALCLLALCATACVGAWPGALLAYVGYERSSNTLMLGGFGAMLILGVPALTYVALGVFLGDLAVVLENLGPVHALRRAWALASGNRLQLFAFGLVSVLVQIASLAGVVLCCVGALATVPLGRALTGFAKTESFLLFTRGHAQTADWRLWQRMQDEHRHDQPEAPAEPGR